jgi:hypothetical protein
VVQQQQQQQQPDQRSKLLQHSCRNTWERS